VKDTRIAVFSYFCVEKLDNRSGRYSSGTFAPDDFSLKRKMDRSSSFFVYVC
jgi:hypothetical protein